MTYDVQFCNSSYITTAAGLRYKSKESIVFVLDFVPVHIYTEIYLWIKTTFSEISVYPGLRCP